MDYFLFCNDQAFINTVKVVFLVITVNFKYRVAGYDIIVVKSEKKYLQYYNIILCSQYMHSTTHSFRCHILLYWLYCVLQYIAHTVLSILACYLPIPNNTCVTMSNEENSL